MSTNNPQNIPCALGTASSGQVLSDDFQQTIQQAMQGGQGTATYFQNQFVSGNFVNWLNANTDSAWIEDVEQQTGYPVYWAAQMGAQTGAQKNASAGSKGSPGPNLKGKTLAQVRQTSNAMYMVLETNPDTDVINGNDQPKQFSWKGTNYNIVGSLTGTLSYNEQPLWKIDVPVGASELVPMGLLTKVAWANLVKPLLTGFWKGVKTSLSQGAESSDVAEIGESAEAGADAAEVSGEEVGEGLTVDMAAGAGAFGVMVVLAAIPLIIDILSHPTYHALKVYNLTAYDVHWAPPTISTGAMCAAPVLSNTSNDYNLLIPAMSDWAPPGVQPVPEAHEADFSFANTRELEGIEYVLPFTVTDPNNNNAQVASAAAVFYLPLLSPNQLYATFSPPQNPADLFNQTLLSQTQQQVAKNGVVLTTTYDYLSGEHPAPDGQNMYTYNSLLVFSSPQSV